MGFNKGFLRLFLLSLVLFGIVIGGVSGEETKLWEPPTSKTSVTTSTGSVSGVIIDTIGPKNGGILKYTPSSNTYSWITGHSNSEWAKELEKLNKYEYKDNTYYFETKEEAQKFIEEGLITNGENLKYNELVKKAQTEKTQILLVFSTKMDSYYNGKANPTLMKELYEAGFRPNENQISNFMSNFKETYTQYTSSLKQLEDKLKDPKLSVENKEGIQKEIDQLNKNNKDTREFAAKLSTDLSLIASYLGNGGQYVDLTKAEDEEESSWSNLFGLTAASAKEKLLQNTLNSISKEVDKARGECGNDVAKCNSNVETVFLKNRLEIAKDYGCDTDVSTGCFNMNEKGQILENNCGANEECLFRLQILEKMAEVQDKRKLVTPNTFYSILSFLSETDSAAMKATKVFGLEDKFNLMKMSGLDQTWLGEGSPSYICRLKTAGYLDKESDSNGGITSYNLNLSGTSNWKKVVAYDLRAQRTPVTPDGKTSISYSYLINEPNGNSYTYTLEILYTDENGAQTYPVKSGSGVGISAGDDNINLPLNTTDVNENSFILTLKVESEAQTLYDVSYPIVLITAGDSYS